MCLPPARTAPGTPTTKPTLYPLPSPQLSGKKAAVVGRSNIVGMPAALLLQREDATVTVIHSRTPDAQRICSEARPGAAAGRRAVHALCCMAAAWARGGGSWGMANGTCAWMRGEPPDAPLPDLPARPPRCAPSLLPPPPPPRAAPAQADIIIAACGKAEMVEGDWVKDGAAVIDVGINAVDGGPGGGGWGGQRSAGMFAHECGAFRRCLAAWVDGSAALGLLSRGTAGGWLVYASHPVPSYPHADLLPLLPPLPLLQTRLPSAATGWWATSTSSRWEAGPCGFGFGQGAAGLGAMLPHVRPAPSHPPSLAPDALAPWPPRLRSARAASPPCQAAWAP